MAALRRGEEDGARWVRRGEEDGARWSAAAGEGAAEGAAAREVSRLIAVLLERVRAEQRQRGAQGPLLRMVRPTPPAALCRLGCFSDCSHPTRTPTPTLPLTQWVRLLLASLSPYVRLLQHWVCEGSLVDPAGDLPHL